MRHLGCFTPVLVSILFIIVGCTGLTATAKPDAVRVQAVKPAAVKGFDAETVSVPVSVDVRPGQVQDVADVMDNITTRVGRLEADMVDVKKTLGVIVLTTEVTAKGVKALSQSVNTGPLSGSGVYACVALGLVLTFQLAALVLWWKLKRDVRKNGVECLPPRSSTARRNATMHPNEFPADVLV